MKTALLRNGDFPTAALPDSSLMYNYKEAVLSYLQHCRMAGWLLYFLFSLCCATIKKLDRKALSIIIIYIPNNIIIYLFFTISNLTLVYILS